MAEVRIRLPKAVRIAGTVLSFILNYLLAGGSLVAVIVLLVLLNGMISQKRASYPPLPPISGNSLAKPIFVQNVPVDTPKTFKGTALSVSPDGSRIAYWGSSKETEEAGFFTARVGDNRGRLVWTFVARHVWSPDSRRILLQARQETLGARGIAIADADDSSDPPAAPAIDWLVLPPDETALSSPPVVVAANWSPDGAAVLFVLSKSTDRASELWRFDLASGQKQRLAILPKEPDKPNTFVRELSVSPDGKKVSFINADRPAAESSSTWWIMNVDGSSSLPLVKRAPGSAFVRRWSWLPDGRKVVYDASAGGDAAYQPTTLWIMNVDGTSRRQLGSSENVEGFALSPKGDWVIYGQDSHLWMANLESGREEQLTFGDDHESLPIWLANGDVLYHHRVGSTTSLRILVHIEPTDIPGLGTSASPKGQ